jgi:hypothetical protein
MLSRDTVRQRPVAIVGRDVAVGLAHDARRSKPPAIATGEHMASGRQQQPAAEESGLPRRSWRSSRIAGNSFPIAREIQRRTASVTTTSTRAQVREPLSKSKSAATTRER